MPGGQDVTAGVVPRFTKETAVRLASTLREGKRVATLLRQTIGAQPAQQHIIRSLILGVQLQPVALEPLHLAWLAFDQLLLLRADRQPERR